LAYLVGLPAHEVPAVDIARGDLIEVQPSAYGVKTRMFHFWSGPGRKDVEAENSGLDSEMGNMKGGSQGDGNVNIYSNTTTSPPKSKLQLEHAHRSRAASLANLDDRPLVTSPTAADEAPGLSKLVRATQGSQEPGVGAPERVMRGNENALADSLECPKASAPINIPTALPLSLSLPPPQIQLDETPESPTHASKVLPKIEPSLGADEAGQVAAKIEAADTRPTFYENVVEGAVKRKKTQGPLASQLATPTSFSTLELERPSL
jgi:6-phosphofructo-2-kinase/fructose-2,6-biphosphatase 4